MYSFRFGGREFYVPDRMMGGIRRYIEHGIKPGDFLVAVITNNLLDSVTLSDDENLVNLPAFVHYFYNEAPAICWGSKEKMDNWVKAKHEERVRKKRDELKRNLAKLGDEQKIIFKKFYSLEINISIDEIIDGMSEDILDEAVYRVQNTFIQTLNSDDQGKIRQQF